MTTHFLFLMLLSSALLSAEALPSYYKEHLEEKLSVIKQDRANQRDGFVFWTDSHVKSNSKHSPELINEILKADPSPKVFFGGDCMPATGKSIEESLNIHRELVGRINGKAAFFCLRGNHDFYYRDKDNRAEGKTLSQEETASVLGGLIRGKAVKNTADAGACYFYSDNPKAKIRYIVFDTNDKTVGQDKPLGTKEGISEAQLNWIREKAVAEAPANYSFVFLMHIPIAHPLCITKFKDALWFVDSVAESGRLLMVICGHTHHDFQLYRHGVLWTTSVSDAYYCNADRTPYLQKKQLVRKNSVREQAIDYISIHDDVILKTRVGFGSDKIFHIKETSLLPGDSIKLNTCLGNGARWFAYDCESARFVKDSNYAGHWELKNDVVSISEDGILKAYVDGDAVAVAISADTSKIEVFPIGVKTSSLTKTDLKALNAAPFATLSDGYLTSISPKGWIREFLLRQASGLSGHPEAMSYPFNTNLWNGRIERMSTHGNGWWRYEQTAYYSDGLLRLGYLLGREDFIKKVEDGARYTIANAKPSGEIGDEDILKAKSQYMWPQAVYFRVLKAMYDKDRDPSIPATLEKYYLHYTPEQVGNLRNIVNIEGILWTYGITGNKALLDLAEKAYETGYFELYPGIAETEGCPSIHGVTYNEQLKVPAILYMWTGKEKYRKIALALEYNLVRYNMLPDGVNSSAEHLYGNSVSNAHETCDIADFSWTQGYFLEMTGDAKFADQIEKAVFNACPGAITKDFKAIQYLSNINQFRCTADSDPNLFKYGSTWTAYRSSHETECCVGNIHRIMPNFVSRMWLSDANGGITAAMYGPSEFLASGLRIEEQTNYPFDENIRFVFHTKKNQKLNFSFRIPGWCKSYAVLINGKKTDVEPLSNGYATLSRIFKDSDVVEVKLDMPIRFTYPSGQGVAIERGPLLFSYPIPTKWIEDTEEHANMRGKKSANPDFKCWNLEPDGPFNYCISKHKAEVVRNESAYGAYPFDNPPYYIKVNVCGMKWALTKDGKTPQIPMNRVKARKNENTDLLLVPYGCTQLRLTVFPDAKEIK